jgi:hypothetical protein
MDLSEFYEDKLRPCLFSRVTKDLNKDDLAKLDAALEEAEIAVSSIDRWLQKHGIKISNATIRRHRKKECDCGKDA